MTELHHRLGGGPYGRARFGPYRVVYEIIDDPPTVRVVRIDHRADVYRPR